MFINQRKNMEGAFSKFKIIKESFDGFTYSTGNKKDVGVLSYRNMTYFGPT